MRLKWEQADPNERRIICQNYLAHNPECSSTVEDLDFAWNGCWFDVIKYTFGPDSWTMK